MKRLRTLAASALAAYLVACGSETPPPQPPSFERPGRVAFACFQTTGRDAPRPWPMRLCEDKEAQLDSEADLSVHALVTQTSRGEVAAVDIEQRRVLDSRKDIPGYTFLPVGELPSAIVVPRQHPDQTYVANFGSRTISVLRTGAFQNLLVGENATLQTVDLRLPGAKTALAPVDMVVTPDEDALLVAVPDAGALLRLPIRRCDLSDHADAGAGCEDGSIDTEAITEVSLAGSIALAAVPPGGEVDREAYRFVCNQDALLPDPKHVTVELPADAATTTPQPVALAVDAYCERGTTCARRVLVADRSQPVIHVLDLDALARGEDGLMAPIVTGVPTTAVVVTPRVPKSLESADGETQYAYAIDATDGSVLVAQDGKVLSVSSDPATRADRVAFGTANATGNAVAVSLAMLTPDFHVDRTAFQFARGPDRAKSELPRSAPACTDEDHAERTQARLRGVFLSVGLTDGTVRIVDVHDMELLECRSCNAGDPYPMVRHRTRISPTFDPDEKFPYLAPRTIPGFTIGASGFPVEIDGTTRDPRVEGLSCVPCAAPLLAAFPAPSDLESDVDADGGVDDDDGGTDDGLIEIAHGPGPGHRCPVGEARVCAMSDPWTSADNWQAVYEGIIPGTQGGHGRFIDTTSTENISGALEFTGEIDFCSAGAQVRDQLVITTPNTQLDTLPEALRDNCERLFSLRDEDRLIAFPIERVFGDRVQIGTHMIDRSLPRSLQTWDFVASCFSNMLVSFDMRTHDAYTVLSGANFGFLHRNVLDEATGHCDVDTAQSPLRQGRAYEDAPFTNPVVSFELAGRSNAAGKRLLPAPRTVLTIQLVHAAPKIYFDAAVTSYDRLYGVLPSDMRYSPENQKLFIVDPTVRGLIPVSTDPFPQYASTAFQ